MPFCVGVTGGIGSGKSRAASMFGELGAGIVDTDAISHEITGVGGSAMPAIIEAFGDSVVAADGSLDRAVMRRLVFANPQARKQLESILHPRIREHARHQVAQSAAPYVLLVVPLLLETGGYRDLIQRVLVIDCDESLQIIRARQRSQITEEAVRAIMAAQLPRQQRLAGADDIIRNDGDMAHLRHQVTVLHQRYLTMAAGAASKEQG
ncbi:MAG: dephospho-CoA kinase [Betaproteobacteria bacterium]|nr:MAG: dephospho-CoA kinase [Betaproteobacteria bacterium]